MQRATTMMRNNEDAAVVDRNQSPAERRARRRSRRGSRTVEKMPSIYQAATEAEAYDAGADVGSGSKTFKTRNTSGVTVAASTKKSASPPPARALASQSSSISDESIRLMPFLFDMLDVDNSGTLDRAEVIFGCARKIRAKGLPITEQHIKDIERYMTDSDVNDDQHLDRSEFGTFLLRLASLMGMSLERVATSLIDDTQHFQTLGWDLVPILFDQFDTDESGTISRHEISIGLRSFDINASFAQCMNMMSEVDRNNDSELDETEFVAFLARYSLASGIPLIECVEHLLEEATSFGEVDLALEGWKMMPLLFDEFDRDQSGSVSREELVSGIGGLIEQGGLNCDLSMVYEIMSEVDEDNDEVLDRREFGFFLSKFAVRAAISLDEVTFYLMAEKRAESRRKSQQGAPNQITEVHNDAKGWSQCDKLFRLMDINDDGVLQKNELWTVINRFRCSNSKVRIQSLECLKILENVSKGGANSDEQQIDPREFAAFIARLALATGLELEEITDLMMEEIKCDVSSKPTWHGIKYLFACADTRLAEESIETIRTIQERRASVTSNTTTTVVQRRRRGSTARSA